MSDNPSLLVRGLLVIVLAVGVLGFGAIGLCGGYFTVNVLTALVEPGGGSALTFLVLSLPCLIGGIAAVIACIKKMARLFSAPPSKDTAP
jgi:hypothetical protein